MRAFFSAAVGSAAIVLSLNSRVAQAQQRPIGCDQWRIVARESGPDNYYVTMHDPERSFVRGRYVPPEKTAVLGYQVADGDRSKVRTLRWKWRAVSLPRGGNECAEGRQDSAAVVYVTYKRMFRWYTLKYVWSSVGPKGVTCDRHRNPFSAQDTVILESGGPTDEWKSEDIDLRAEFRAHFEDGRADADVPPLVGVGLMSDGDATKSVSAADYADFVLGW
ncbi:MAG: DUF3047 domain-containing protein [Polyangiaceae bacterium]